jgi:hypothetical protein
VDQSPDPINTSQHMKTSDKKKLITINLALWVVAVLLHPLVRMLPTGSGNPPKIFELLVPVFTILLAATSTYLLSSAIGKPTDE